MIYVSEKQVKNAFQYHPPFGDQVQRYQSIRTGHLLLAQDLLKLCPQSPELRRAIGHLEEACMWANAAIARNEAPPEFLEPNPDA